MSERSHKIMITALVVGPLCAVFAAIVLLWNRYVFPSDIALLLTMYAVTTLGIGTGYHRMLTHRGFRAPHWLRAILLTLGALAVEGAPAQWAATHIKHHAHSDDDLDPHSPQEGFWHAHLGWLYDSKNFPNVREYAPHLLGDPVVMFIERNIGWFYLVSVLIPFAVGGWTGLIWGGGVRIFLVNHVTWSVNSICHCFGSKPYETTDESRNNWLVGLLAFGEGWHNNHHAFPENAFHGMRWYQLDGNGLLIRALEGIGLVSQVERVSPDAVASHGVRGKSMHESIQELKADFSRRIDLAREELSMMMAKLPSLPPERIAAIHRVHERTLKRFADIQQRVLRRRNLKRRTIEQRQQEIAELLEQAKQRLQLATA